MPDIIDLLQKWWKQMLLIVILAVVAACVVVFLQPKQYRAVATAVPASSYGADRSRIFNENVQALYSTLGVPDDLDRIVGTGQLDTVYRAVAVALSLDQHYKVGEKGQAAIAKSASRLKSNTRVIKSEYGELKVKVWDKDAELSADLANAVMDNLQSIHQSIQAEGNLATLAGLRTGQQKIQAETDSIRLMLATSTFPPGGDETYTERLNVLSTQKARYDKLIAEYDLLIETKPPVLISVERARTPEWPARPLKTKVLVATAVLAFFFSLLFALVLERRKQLRG